MNIQNIIKAAEVAKSKTANRRWHAACDKAVAGASTWIITELATSTAITTESGQTYFVTENHCQCRAFELNQPCKHRCLVALRRLAETAPVVVSRPALIADIKAAWSRRFPGESLADELMRRFRKNKLEMLAEDMLRGVLAAIA